MTTAALASHLPSAPSSRTGKPPAAIPPVVAAGDTFADRARVILAASPDTDTADNLDAALASGDREVARIEAEVSAAQSVAVDPLTSADDAATAEARNVSLGLALRRTRSAVGQLEARLTAYQKRVAEMRAEAERRAVLDRHAAAVEAVRSRYPTVADELAGLFSELVAASRECERRKIAHDNSIGFALGIVGAMGNVGVIYMPKIDDGGTHWPVMKSPGELRAMSRMMSGRPWED